MAANRASVPTDGKPSPVLKLFLPLSLWILSRFELAKRFSTLHSRIHVLISSLYGRKEAVALTELFIAKVISFILLAISFFLLLFLLSGLDGAVLLPGLIIVSLLPFLMIRHLEQQVRKKKRAMVLELPLFLNQLILLVNAGENVQQAIVRVVKQQKGMEEHPLYSNLHKVVHKMEARVSFPQVMDELNQDCGIHEVSIFVNTLLQQYRRGGGELVSALKSYAYQLWETRKQAAKSLGEEASSKLIFPMVLIFMAVIIVIAAPVVIWMK